VAQQSAAAEQARARTAEAQTNAARAQSAALQRRLAALQARPTEGGLLVTPGDLLFEFGRAEIRPPADDSPRMPAASLREHRGRQPMVEGCADSVGSNGASLLLSKRRVEACIPDGNRPLRARG
jgi:outer membrane protein OmpA-like peptidoglycan-associated protein